jgi:hypothetical protein
MVGVSAPIVFMLAIVILIAAPIPTLIAFAALLSIVTPFSTASSPLAGRERQGQDEQTNTGGHTFHLLSPEGVSPPRSRPARCRKSVDGYIIPLNRARR